MEFKTYDNAILIEGKKYWWSGHCDCGLYTSESWHRNKCKIRKIEGDRIFVYDYGDGKEWEFTNEELRKNSVTFLKRNLLNLFHLAVAD